GSSDGTDTVPLSAKGKLGSLFEGPSLVNNHRPGDGKAERAFASPGFRSDFQTQVVRPRGRGFEYEHVVLEAHWKSGPFPLLVSRLILQNAVQLVGLGRTVRQREAGILVAGALRLNWLRGEFAGCDHCLRTESNETVLARGDLLAGGRLGRPRATDRDAR